MYTTYNLSVLVAIKNLHVRAGLPQHGKAKAISKNATVRYTANCKTTNTHKTRERKALFVLREMHEEINGTQKGKIR